MPSPTDRRGADVRPAAAAADAAASPTFSVVVPTYARPERLRACVEALARLDYPRDRFEVVVVDDASPVSPDAALAPLRGRLDLTLLRLPANAGPAAARNAGAARATGQHLAFTDDDCAPQPGWLRAFAEGFAAAPDHLLGGRTVNALAGNPFSAASQQLIDYLYAHYNRAPGEARFFASNNMAVPADLFRAIGGFDTGFPLAAGEDREFCHRWLAGGGAMAYAADAIVEHAHALTLRRFWRQHYNYGRGAFHLDRALRRSGRRSLDVEPLAFYINLVGHPLRNRTRHGRVAGAALMVVSQVANAAGFFAEWARGGRTPEAGTGGPGWCGGGEPAGGRAVPRRSDLGPPSE